MSRITVFLDDDVINNLKDLDKNSNRSLSKIIAELVDIGYKVRQHHQNLNPQEVKKAELIDRHTEYLLRVMSIAADIYRCILNDKSKYKEANAESALNVITSNAQSYINGQLGKNQ